MSPRRRRAYRVTAAMTRTRSWSDSPTNHSSRSRTVSGTACPVNQYRIVRGSRHASRRAKSRSLRPDSCSAAITSSSSVVLLFVLSFIGIDGKTIEAGWLLRPRRFSYSIGERLERYTGNLGRALFQPDAVVRVRDV